MNKIIEEIVSKGTTLTSDGVSVKATSTISKVQGEYIYDLIKNNNDIIKTLEIGCANGLSSLYICEALKDRDCSEHYIIDPYQSKDWKNRGITALKRAGLYKTVNLIEKESEFILPELLEKKGEYFDLIFIDGWHSFDHVMLDIFYSLRLLKLEGFLILDDCSISSVEKAVQCIDNYCFINKIQSVFVYPDRFLPRIICHIGKFIPLSVNIRYRLPKLIKNIIRRPRMIIYQKIASDDRKWNWFAPF